MKKRNFLVPISTKEGKLATNDYVYGASTKMVPNFEIELDLTLVEIRPTRGSFRAIFEDCEHYKYYMMGSDFNQTLKHVNALSIYGIFTVAHKSYDYTIRLIDPANDEPLNEAKMVQMVQTMYERKY
jgi:hypothetical protein